MVEANKDGEQKKNFEETIKEKVVNLIVEKDSAGTGARSGEKGIILRTGAHWSSERRTIAVVVGRVYRILDSTNSNSEMTIAKVVRLVAELRATGYGTQPVVK